VLGGKGKGNHQDLRAGGLSATVGVSHDVWHWPWLITSCQESRCSLRRSAPTVMPELVKTDQAVDRGIVTRLARAGPVRSPRTGDDNDTDIIFCTA